MAQRMLYLLNISNPDRLSSDSGWVFADLLAPALADAGAEVTVAAPAQVGTRGAGSTARACRARSTEPGSPLMWTK